MPKYLCAFFAVLALAVGCGDGAPTKQAFIADLDQVCKSTQKKLLKVKRPQTVKEFGSFARDTRPIVEDSVKQADGLPLPDEKRDEFEAYIEDSKRSLSQFDDLEKAADAGDGAAVGRVLGKIADGSRKRDRQAKKLGLKQCAGG